MSTRTWISFVVFICCALNFVFAAIKFCEAKQRISIDNIDVGEEDEIMLHLGNNIWVKGNAVFTDDDGLYTFDKNLTKSKNADEGWGYVKHWKCPYCYVYWPVGQKCQNEECPSRY